MIVNALGADGLDHPNAGNRAFTDEECDAVVDWVKAGGALLLIVDRYPTGKAVESLATRLGVEVSDGYCTIDRENSWERSDDPSHLEFSHVNGLLGDHPIIQGRDVREHVERVVTFTGQSLQGPAGSVSFLTFGRYGVRHRPVQSPLANTRGWSFARPRVHPGQGTCGDDGRGGNLHRAS